MRAINDTPHTLDMDIVISDEMAELMKRLVRNYQVKMARIIMVTYLTRLCELRFIEARELTFHYLEDQFPVEMAAHKLRLQRRGNRIYQ